MRANLPADTPDTVHPPHGITRSAPSHATCVRGIECAFRPASLNRVVCPARSGGRYFLFGPDRS
jgi:hypothetical protein